MIGPSVLPLHKLPFSPLKPYIPSNRVSGRKGGHLGHHIFLPAFK